LAAPAAGTGAALEALLATIAPPFVDANAPRLNDPQSAPQVVDVEHCNEVANSVQQASGRRAGTGFQNGNAGSILGRKSKNVSKVMVQRDQRSTFFPALQEHSIIGCAPEAFTANGLNIMAGKPSTTTYRGCQDSHRA
jgi:hypothetical protein